MSSGLGSSPGWLPGDGTCFVPLCELESVTDENPTVDMPFRYAELGGKRFQIQVVDS